MDKYVTELNPSDVLFGRGSGPNDHEGNIKFREYVAERKGEYMATNHRQTKARIAKEIVDAVYSRNGRFLKKLETNEATKLGFSQGVDAYIMADENTIMEKAKQALRQNRDKNAPKLPDGQTSPKRLSPVPSRQTMDPSSLNAAAAAGLMGHGGPAMPHLNNNQQHQHQQHHQMHQAQAHINNMHHQQLHQNAQAQPQQLYGNPGFPLPASQTTILPGMDGNGGVGSNDQIYPLASSIGNQVVGNINAAGQMQPPAPINANVNGADMNNLQQQQQQQNFDGTPRESEFLTYTTTLADTPGDDRRAPRLSSNSRDSMQWMNDTGSRRGSLSGAVLSFGQGGSRRGGSFLRKSEASNQAKRESLQVSDVFGSGKRDSLQVTDVFAYSNMPKRASSITAASMQMSELMESFKGMSTQGDFQSDDDTIDTIDPIGMGPHHMSGLSSMSVMSISSATSLFKNTADSAHAKANGPSAVKSNMYTSENHIKEEDGEDQTNQDQQQDEKPQQLSQQQQQQLLQQQQQQQMLQMAGQHPNIQMMQGRPSDLSSINDGARLSSTLRLSNLDDMSWAASAAMNGSIRQSIAPQDLWNGGRTSGTQHSSGNMSLNPRPLGSMQEHPDNFSSLGSSGLAFMRTAANLESLENIEETAAPPQQLHRQHQQQQQQNQESEG